MKINRRQLIVLGGMGFFAGLSGIAIKSANQSKDSDQRINSTLSGPSRKRGHLVRFYKDKEPSHVETQETVIVGGGVSGLSAAYHLNQKGASYTLLELEGSIGGNSRSMQKDGVNSPLGAHYTQPAPPNNTGLISFYEKINVIVGRNEENIPIYNEDYLLKQPSYRNRIGDEWSYGQIAWKFMSRDEQRELGAFFEFADKWALKIGRDGRRAFRTPIEDSSRDPEILELDNISFSKFLKQQGFESPIVFKYSNNFTIEEYGAPADKVSAWAGMHYLCGWAESSDYIAQKNRYPTLTWPEGNWFLVDKLKSMIPDESIKTDAVVMKCHKTTSGYSIKLMKAENKEIVEIKCKNLILATPMYVNKYIAPELTEEFDVPSYIPWLVTNVMLTSEAEEILENIHWSNTADKSEGMGYVYAQHQTKKNTEDPYVITYYHALTNGDDKSSRRRAYSTEKQHWDEFVLSDLEIINPGVSKYVISMDHYLWGHGMSAPVIGYTWGEKNSKRRDRSGSLLFCHSDVSALSTFEEAFYLGEKAAESVEQGGETIDKS